MTSYQTGPFDAPRTIPPAPKRTSISGPSSHRGSFSRASPEQQQQAAEEGYFGPNGAVPSGPAPPNRYAPPSPQYQSEPTSPMNIPQSQQPYNTAQQQLYGTSPLRQSTTYGTSPTYQQQQTQQYSTSPQGRRASQPYLAGAGSYDRRPSLPAAQPPPPLQAPVDQLHPSEAYYSPQQSAPGFTNGRRASQASIPSPRHSYESGDNNNNINYDDGYDRRGVSEGGRRRSEATQPRPQIAFDDRRASSARPSGLDEDDEDDYRRRRRSRDEDYDRRERRASKGSSNGSSSGRSKKEIEKMKKEAYGRPSYVDSLSWAGRSVKKFLSSERE